MWASHRDEVLQAFQMMGEKLVERYTETAKSEGPGVIVFEKVITEQHSRRASRDDIYWESIRGFKELWGKETGLIYQNLLANYTPNDKSAYGVISVVLVKEDAPIITVSQLYKLTPTGITARYQTPFSRMSCLVEAMGPDRKGVRPQERTPIKELWDSLP